MPITIRSADYRDLDAADALVVESINELTERHGFGAIASRSPPLLQKFSLHDDPAGLWVAEDGNEIVGFGLSWTNDDFWFLAQLFVRPDRQADGVGSQLMEKALDHAKTRKARSRALITFAFNRASQGLYMRHGLYPVTPLYVMGGSKSAVAKRVADSELTAEPLEPTDAAKSWLSDIDLAGLGVSRSKHHTYMLGEGGLKGHVFREGGERVAYAYIGYDGHIGPVAVRETRLMPAALSSALALACQGPSERVSAVLPGSSSPALKCALDAGLRIGLPLLLMGDNLPRPWDRYCPRNPGLM